MSWSRSSRKGVRPKAKYHKLRSVWTAYNRRQERKYKTPRALSRRGEWKYSRNRTEEREKQVKRSVSALNSINQWANNLFMAIAKRLGYTPFKPERVDSERYIVEVISE